MLFPYCAGKKRTIGIAIGLCNPKANAKATCRLAGRLCVCLFILMTMAFAAAGAAATIRVGRLAFGMTGTAIRTTDALFAAFFCFDDVSYGTADDESDNCQHDNICSVHDAIPPMYGLFIVQP